MIELRFAPVHRKDLEEFASDLKFAGKTDLLQQWRDLLARVEGRFYDNTLMLDKIRSMADAELCRHMEAHFPSYFY